MDSIGDTEESAKGPATAFVAGSPEVEAAVLALYDAPMPASDVAPATMFGSGWGWGTTAAPAPAPG